MSSVDPSFLDQPAHSSAAASSPAVVGADAHVPPGSGAATPETGLARTTLGDRFSSWRKRHLRIGSYPRGLLLVLLRSRAAPWIGRLLTLTLFICAALPDAGFEMRPHRYAFVIGLGVLFLLTESFRTLVVGTGQDAYRQAAASVGLLISDFTGKLSGVGNSTIHTPQETIGAMLRRARDFVHKSLKIPEGEVITATLLLPHPEPPNSIDGFLEAKFDDLYPGRSSRVLPLDLAGARAAFAGNAAALPHTQTEQCFASFPPFYRSVAYFPILRGIGEGEAVVVGLLAIESSEEYRFDERTVQNLEAFISPIAQLIGLARAFDKRREE